MSIISHTHGFIFLKTRKTAGSSIEIALAQYCAHGDTIVTAEDAVEYGMDRKVNQVVENSERTLGQHAAFGALYLKSVLKGNRAKRKRKLADHAYSRYGGKAIKQHMRAADMREAVGEEVWSRYFTFCFERNPWDRLVSFYHWRTKSMNSPPEFKDFAMAALFGPPERQSALKAKYFSNRPFYLSDGELCVDFVGRYEDLEADLARAAERLGLSWDGSLPDAKRGIRPAGRNYREYYDAELPNASGIAE